MSTDISAPSVYVSWGELFDKISILRIKRERLTAPDKLANVAHELHILEAAAAPASHPALPDLAARLKAVNEGLWDIEDDIRDQERAQDFGARFVELARSVYFENDKRAAIKREINVALGSSLIEEKSYQAY